jgi:hypothetical protein
VQLEIDTGIAVVELTQDARQQVACLRVDRPIDSVPSSSDDSSCPTLRTLSTLCRIVRAYSTTDSPAGVSAIQLIHQI